MLSRRGAACQPIIQAVVLMVSCACVQPAIHAPSPAFCGIGSACKGPADLRRRLPAANLHAKALSRQRQTPSSAPRSLRRLQMVGDNAKWADGGSGGARFWNEDPVAEAMAGSWKVDWSQDDKLRSAIVNLLADGRVAPPDDSDKSHVEKVRLRATSPTLCVIVCVCARARACACVACVRACAGVCEHDQQQAREPLKDLNLNLTLKGKSVNPSPNL